MDVKFLSRGNSPIIEPHYWANQVIRKESNLGDLSIAVRRQLPYGNPDRFYNVFIEDGEVKTAIRKYPSYYDKSWTEQFSLGIGSACAIAFDGYWRMYEFKWRYINYEKPFLFWVDGDNKLQTQKWDDVSTKFELTNNVVKVKAIRAWKNASYIDKDQGIVALYIKSDGKVYYRNYCQQADGDFTWEVEKELIEFTGVAVNVNLFITNDYRFGIVVEDSLGKIHWFITFQNWAGMAIPPENISVSPVEVSATLIDIEYPVLYHPDENISVSPFKIIGDLRYAKTDNKFISIHNEMVIVKDENNVDVEDWGKRLIVRTQNELYDIFPGDFQVLDGFNNPYYPNTVTELEDSVYQLDFLEFNSFNNVDKYGTLKFRGTVTKNGVGNLYLPFEMDFEPINLVPIIIPLPEVETIYNE